jgi:hypothetical protein
MHWACGRSENETERASARDSRIRIRRSMSSFLRAQRKVEKKLDVQTQVET